MMNAMNKKLHSNANANANSGSALHILLLAIVLFAAISAVITQSGKGGSDVVGPEKAKIYAGEILNYANKISEAVHKVMLINDCTDTQISFERAPFDGSDTNYVNPNAPSDFSCHVFHPNGGWVSERQINTDWIKGSGLAKWYGAFFYTGVDCVPGIGLGGDHLCFNTNDNDDTELNIVLVDVKDEVCDQINSRLGTEKPTQLDGNDFFYKAGDEATYGFKGEYGYLPKPNTLSSHIYSAGYLTQSKKAACFYSVNAATNIFYSVLLAR